MNNRTKITTLLLLIAISLAWLEVVAAKGPPIRVTEAIPSEAEQGQQGLLVKIKGKGFFRHSLKIDRSVHQLRKCKCSYRHICK